MKLNKVLGVIAATAAFVLPLAASASTTQNFLLLDGLTSETVSSNSTVDLNLQFTNTGNSTAQSALVEIPGSGFPSECIDIVDQNQIGIHTTDFTVNTEGATEGQWPVKITLFGINRVSNGSQPTDSDCTTGSSGTHTFNNQLTISDVQNTGNTVNNTGNGGVNGGTVGSTGTESSDISNLIALIKAWFSAQASSSAPVANSTCTQLAQLDVGVAMGSMGPSVSNLQVFLMSHGGSIPALMNGVPYGYFGSQTQGALFQVKSLNGCN